MNRIPEMPIQKALAVGFSKCVGPHMRRLNLQALNCYLVKQQFGEGAENPFAFRGDCADNRVKNMGLVKKLEGSQYTYTDLLNLFVQLKKQRLRSVTVKEGLLVYSCFLRINNLLSRKMLQFIQQSQPKIAQKLVDLESEQAEQLGLDFSIKLQNKLIDYKPELRKKQLLNSVIHLLLETLAMAKVELTL